MEKLDDKLQVKGVLSQGYGIIPKMLMKDDDLTIEAKAIYAYIASYAGAGSTAFPGVSLICHDLNISENRFHKHKKVLIEKGYIYIDKIRGEGGQFDKNLYTINSVLVPQVPQDEVLPTRQNEVTVKQSPTRQNPCMDKPSMDNPCMENEGTNNNSINNNSFNNNSINNNNNKKEEKPVVVAGEKNAFQIYQENFGMLSPLITEEIMHWQNDLSDELVLEAMKRAALNQKPFSWAVGIMRNWWKKNIKTVEQAEADDTSFSNNMQRNSNYRGNKPKVEAEPDWMKEQQQPKEEKIVDAATQEAFKNRLAQFRKGTEQDQTR